MRIGRKCETLKAATFSAHSLAASKNSAGKAMHRTRAHDHCPSICSEGCQDLFVETVVNARCIVGHRNSN